MLVAAMNPCPCGYFSDPKHDCNCTPLQIQRYMSKISGPLLDRIDIHIEVVPVPFDKLSDKTPVESSEAVRERVIKARNIQEKRFADNPGVYNNAQMSTKLQRKHCYVDQPGKEMLKTAMDKLGLSARAYDRILKVSRTIADLEQCKNIQSNHLAEAIQYRSLDREGWAG